MLFSLKWVNGSLVIPDKNVTSASELKMYSHFLRMCFYFFVRILLNDALNHNSYLDSFFYLQLSTLPSWIAQPTLVLPALEPQLNF